MKNVSALIVAAGSGSRMKADIPKQFLRLGKRTVLYHSICQFLKISGISEIIVIGPPGYLESPEMSESIPVSRVPISVIAGGEKRQDSVFNGLKAIHNDSKIVTIHDGARPLVQADLIQKSIDLCTDFDGAIVAAPSINTLKDVRNNQITQTLDRAVIWQAQTPQTFRRSIIEKAYQYAFDNHFTTTDDAAFVEAVGGKIAIVASNSRNLKITNPEDLLIAQTLFEKDLS